MKCPYCNSDDLKVIDSRDSETSIRRRRECNKCEKRFTTYERVEMIDLMVIKKDGTLQAFDREKLKRSLIKPCEKRPITMEQIEDVVSRIDARLRKDDSTEIPSKKIGELVCEELKKLDKVAYIRFASVYKDFDDVKDFEKEVKALK
ncbi:MAG TPA: transcriptional regulator NrdR [Candidatus Nanoarchaeia archaeon]|nr:transcriptional regulator NrdR [Candidatus Nanoarchaeia archaeon]